MIECALFPIPGSVSFPFSVVPLHVFEPRYLKMIEDCVKEQRLIAVAHTQGVVKEKKATSLKENRSTHKSQFVFSAGKCEILQTTDDGRYLVQVEMQKRLILKEITQHVPYQIVNCDELFDSHNVSFDGSTKSQKNDIYGFLKKCVAQDLSAQKILDDYLVNETDIGQFTFKVFQFLRLSPEKMQLILELQDPLERLKMISDIVESASEQLN